ncbi:MAG: hypothetical protein KDI09_17685 [Halioglobus sp.]|nr:hypothetical protein [Halioglobus sp.]
MKPPRSLSWLPFGIICLGSVLAALWLRSGTDAMVFATLNAWLATLGNRFADTDVDQKEIEKTRQHAAPARTASHEPAILAGSGALSPADHTRGDHAVCARPRTSAAKLRIRRQQ